MIYSDIDIGYKNTGNKNISVIRTFSYTSGDVLITGSDARKFDLLLSRPAKTFL